MTLTIVSVWGSNSGRRPQRLDCYRVFLDLICPPLEVLLTYVFQYPDKTDGAPEDTGGQEPLDLCFFRIGVKPCMREKLGRLGRFHNAQFYPSPQMAFSLEIGRRIYNRVTVGTVGEFHIRPAKTRTNSNKAR